MILLAEGGKSILIWHDKEKPAEMRVFPLFMRVFRLFALCAYCLFFAFFCVSRAQKKHRKISKNAPSGDGGGIAAFRP